MTFGQSWLIKAVVVCGVASLAQTAALSDVLELNADGARWVAGGPLPPPDANAAMVEPPAGETRSLAQLVAALPSGVGGSKPSFAPLTRPSVSSGFGYRKHPILGGRRMHSGIDLSAPTGTPVYATALGVVSKAGWLGSYGLLIKLEHADAIQTRYGHLSRLAVQEGQIVEPGQLIGYVGSTGRSIGPHLHYEVRVQGQAVNPMPYMRSR